MARVVAGAFGYVVISIGGFPAATHFSLCSRNAFSSTVPRMGAARLPQVSATE